MNKFLAVVKHEYKKVVFKWSFLIGTFMMPFLSALFVIVPAILLSIKGEPGRIIVIDPTDRIAARLKLNLSAERMLEKSREALNDSFNDLTPSHEEGMKRNAAALESGYVFVDYDANGKSDEQIRRELLGLLLDSKIDAYLLIPANLSGDQPFEFRTRRSQDAFGGNTFRDALNDAVRSQRLADSNINEQELDALGRSVNFDEKTLDEKGDEKNDAGTWIAAFVVGLMIYILLISFGQTILGAVVEEKETRIAEILFSSIRPFELMAGKLVGVGLAGLTQLSIWLFSALAVLVFAVAQSPVSDALKQLPTINALTLIYFLIFFLIGFFVYASIFALIGSMVTTVQEGSQFSFPPVMILLFGFYFSFAVVRNPGSSLAFWVSLIPLFSPIVMPVRILSESPPFWQIALSIAIGAVTIAGVVWITARVYRVGMLMYGKRATIPEVWKWIWHY